MSPTFMRVSWLIIAIAASLSRSQGKLASLLDEPKPTSWNKPDLSIPAAPPIQEPWILVARDQARPPQLEERMISRKRLGG